jgi:hypothetical protein
MLSLNLAAACPRRYVHEDPYRNDHRFHGWIGLCCFHLAKAANCREVQAKQPRGGSDPRLGDKGIGARIPPRRRDYVADAREHLLRALELNPREDQYVRCLSQVLLWAGKKSVAKNLLLNFCLLNPNNPEGFRYFTKLASSQLAMILIQLPRSHTRTHARSLARVVACCVLRRQRHICVRVLDCQIALRSFVRYRRCRFHAKLRAAERCFSFSTLRPGLLPCVGYSQTHEQSLRRQATRIASSAAIKRRSGHATWCYWGPA